MTTIADKDRTGMMQKKYHVVPGLKYARELIASMACGPIDISAVYLGWNAETLQSAASYTIRLPDEGLALDASSKLIFSLADSNEDPTPDICPEWFLLFAAADRPNHHEGSRYRCPGNDRRRG